MEEAWVPTDLREDRLAAGYSLQQLAHVTGIDAGQIEQYEETGSIHSVNHHIKLYYALLPLGTVTVSITDGKQVEESYLMDLEENVQSEVDSMRPAAIKILGLEGAEEALRELAGILRRRIQLIHEGEIEIP